MFLGLRVLGLMFSGIRVFGVFGLGLQGFWILRFSAFRVLVLGFLAR